MTEARWKQVYALYEVAVELPPEERTRFLETECQRNPDTAGEVARLLELQNQAGDFLEPPTPSTFAVGDLVGARFEVEALIGAGGMGEVFRAHDCELGVKVAIKTVHLDRLGDPAAQERLRREALVARRVTHRNVCRIFDVFRHRLREGSEDVVVLAMELLEGPTLREHLAGKGPLAENEAVEIALDVCAGLEAAHQQGVIHRDLKPANIILAGGSEGRRAVITDFGLARPSTALYESSSATQTGALAGTLDYMAPELLRGGQATEASDLYALGVLLFEMVTGALPHQGAASVDQLLKRFLEPAASPRGVKNSVSRSWDALTRHCLDRDPERRPRSAAEVAKLLRRGGAVVLSRIDRRRFLVGVGAACAAGGAAFVWWGRRPLRIIVFAIENQGGDPALNYLCQGMTTELTRQLALIPGVRIVPYYEPKPKQSRSFPAAYTLAGSMQGQALRMELADAGDGSIVWTQQLDRSRYNSPVEAQGDLVRGVTEALRTAHPAGSRLAGFVSSDPAPGPATDNGEAFDLYMRAGALLRERTLAQTTTAVMYLQRALSLDPHFALAYASLAEAHQNLIEYAAAPIAELLLRGHGYAERAVREGPHLPEAHLALASFRQHLWDWDGATESFREALRLRPNYARAIQWYAGMRLQFGPTPEIIADMKQALELDPYDQVIRTGYSLGLFFSDQYEEAIRVQEPSATVRNSITARQQIGNVYAYQASISSGWRRDELFEKAYAQAAAVDQLENRPEAPAANGMRHADRMYSLYYALAGKADAAAPYLERLESQTPVGLVSPAMIARAYAALGQTEHALDLIETAIARKDRVLLYLKVNPFFRSLRLYPRYQQFLRIIQL